MSRDPKMYLEVSSEFRALGESNGETTASSSSRELLSLERASTCRPAAADIHVIVPPGVAWGGGEGCLLKWPTGPPLLASARKKKEYM